MFERRLLEFVIVTSFLYVIHGALPPKLQRQVDASRDDVKKILGYIRGDGAGRTYDRLALLGDSFGSRLSGSESLEKAINYIIDNLTAEGFKNVNKEPVNVTKWTRGKEYGWLHMSYGLRPMFIMALGSSVNTSGNLTEQTFVVRSFDELRARCGEAAGKIVVYNQPWTNYAESGLYRRTGAFEAAKCNAKASLVRSVTARSIYSPHTGQQNYGDAPKIPTASITVEDAALLQRFQDRGSPRNVTIYMEAENHPDTISYNVVAELLGSTYPNQTVIFGGHIDTWDVTDGSMDDGGGVMMAWEAISLIKKLDLKPKRTIRLVLWTSEEVGLIGGRKYYDDHKEETPRTSIIMQADHGSFRPHGIMFSGTDLARSVMEEILGMLVEINASRVHNGGGSSSDTGWWVTDGVPGSELLSANENYFDYHHTLGDAMTALDRVELDHCTAVWATVAYAVANMDELLPRTNDYVDAAVTQQSMNVIGTLLVAALVAVRL